MATRSARSGQWGNPRARARRMEGRYLLRSTPQVRWRGIRAGRQADRPPCNDRRPQNWLRHFVALVPRRGWRIRGGRTQGPTRL